MAQTAGTSSIARDLGPVEGEAGGGVDQDRLEVAVGGP